MSKIMILDQLVRVVPSAAVRRAAAAVAVLVPTCAALAQTDRINDRSTGWWFGYGATSASIDTNMTNGQRPFNIGYAGASTYDVILVQNSGEYAATGMDAYWNMSTSSISLNLSLSSNRIIDLEVVNSATGTFSAVVVDNSGATAATGWDWETGLTFAGMVNWQAANGLRPIDVDQYSTLAGTRYSIVAVPNTGNNHQSGWWWDFGITEAQVTSFLTSRSARLIDIDIADNNPLRFNAIMVSENPGGGWWHPGLTSAQVNDFVNQNAARLTCLQRYTDAGGATKFAVAGVDNANAQTRRIRNMMAAETDGFKGAYLRQVNGPTLVALDSARTFEPASMIKILIGAYAIDQCAAGNDDPTNDIFIRDTCFNDECPSTNSSCNSGNEDLIIAIEEMLEQSDNNRTMELELRYGRATLNNYAASLGLTHTHLNHQLGCGWYDQPRNQFSLEDAGLLYEYITDGTLFNSTWEETLRQRMNDYGSPGGTITGPINTIIATERSDTNLTDEEVAAFRGGCIAMVKAGSYGWPQSQGSAYGYDHRTAGGWCRLPFKTQLGNAWITTSREYVLGTYVNDAVSGPGLSPNPNIAYDAYWELIREQVVEALQSWDAACTTPIINNQPDATSATEGEDAMFQVGLGIGTGSRTYQWQVFDAPQWFNLNDTATFYAGTTTNTLHVLSVHESDQALYRCVVTSPCGTTNSTSAFLTVNPPPSGCDSIDFNGDGLFPDTQDITDFITVFGGGACPTGPGQCGDIDFNNDGLFPDTQDIATFISVFGGGACL